MIYHDTRFKEARHPHLLKEQIDACHAAGIRPQRPPLSVVAVVPVETTVPAARRRYSFSPDQRFVSPVSTPADGTEPTTR